MKYIERLKKEHPECVSDEYSGGCIGCPEDYGYETYRAKCPEGLEYSDVEKGCRECWKRSGWENEL